MAGRQETMPPNMGGACAVAGVQCRQAARSAGVSPRRRSECAVPRRSRRAAQLSPCSECVVLQAGQFLFSRKSSFLFPDLKMRRGKRFEVRQEEEMISFSTFTLMEKEEKEGRTRCVMVRGGGQVCMRVCSEKVRQRDE